MSEKCPCLELFWSAFYRIWLNTDQKTPNTETFQVVEFVKISQGAKLLKWEKSYKWSLRQKSASINYKDFSKN